MGERNERRGSVGPSAHSRWGDLDVGRDRAEGEEIGCRGDGTSALNAASSRLCLPFLPARSGSTNSIWAWSHKGSYIYFFSGQGFQLSWVGSKAPSTFRLQTRISSASTANIKSVAAMAQKSEPRAKAKE